MMNYLAIAFISDRNFFVPTVVSMTSLLENKGKKVDYVIYLASVNFDGQQKKIIRNIEKKYSTKIVIYDVNEDSLREKYSGMARHDCNATVSALIKFDLPDICADESTLLYLDGDIIVKDDLSDFLNIDMNDDTYVAAVKDSGLLYSERLIRQENRHYFNSGIMYLNLNAMRKDGISQKLIEAKLKSTDNSLMDQHVLNQVFGDHLQLIDYAYNTLYINLRRAHYFHNLELSAVNEFCGKQYKTWDDVLDEAKIVHYSSFDKPWKYSDVAGVELWNKYFAISEVHELALNRKALNVRLIEKLMESKFWKPFGILLWELKTKGIVKCFKEAMRWKR